MGRITVNLHVASAATPRRLARATAAVCGAAALALLGGATTASAADQCANAGIRAAQGSTHLPDCRAYEWVSSQNPGGNLAGVDTTGAPQFTSVRADGNKLLFFGTANFGASERGGVFMYHFGERGEQGWTARSGVAPSRPELIIDSLSSNQVGPFPSADLSHYGFTVSSPLVSEAPRGPQLYLSTGTDSPATWLSEPEPGKAPGNVTGFVVGGSEDFSVVYFVTRDILTTQAGDDRRDPWGGWGVYEYRNGILRPAAVLPDGTVPPDGVGLSGQGTQGGVLDTDLASMTRNQVSADGRRLFFVVSSGGVAQLYVREDGARTRLLSHAQGAPTTPSATGIGRGGAQAEGWAYATPSGSHVVFQSRDVLAAGAETAPAGDLKTYRADVATARLTYLPEVGAFPLAVDDDASRILWVGVEAGTSEFHLWDGDVGVDHTLSAGRDTTTFPDINWTGGTADGSTWLLNARTALDPAHPDTRESRQVYRVTLGSGAPVPTCLSCDAEAAYATNATVINWSGTTTENFLGETNVTGTSAAGVSSRPLSADGRRVFFDTREALVAEDVNRARDVYMWEEGRGLGMISSGTTNEPSFYLDSSPSGDDVFITTTAGLVPGDRDESYDIYDVRVAGGFSERPVASCDGDGCQPPASGREGSGAPGSDQLGAVVPGNEELEPSPARLGVRRVARDRTGATLRIATSAAGTVHVSGRKVTTVRRSLSKRGSVSVRLRLTRAARRTLARRGHVEVAVRVRFSPKAGRAAAATVKTTIKRKR